MANWLTKVIQPLIDPEKDLVLDLCCGNGSVMDGIKCKGMMAIDIYEPYIRDFKRKRPDIEFRVLDVRLLPSITPVSFFDIITCIDGLEHLEYDEAIRVLSWMESSAKKRVIVFAPVGYTLNEPKNTWGIQGGDIYQTHKCGLTIPFFTERGYIIAHTRNRSINRYDKSRYRACLYVKET